MKKLKQFAAFLTIIFLTSCNNGQTNSATVSADDISTLKDLTNKWNDCNVKQDLLTLATLYADQLSLYGISISKQQALSNKEAFFKKHSDFNQSITGEITITKITDSQYKAVFPKRSSFSGKTSDVEGYLLFDKVDGKWKITNESDGLTDKNLSIKPLGNTSTSNTASGDIVGETLKGDFDGDGKTETVVLKLVKKGVFEDGAPLEESKLAVEFSNPSIPLIQLTSPHDYLGLTLEGDLDDKPGDEISIYTPPNNGFWGGITTYTFKGGKWKELIEPISYYTATFDGEDSPEATPEQMIFKESGVLYFYAYDLNDENFKRVKTKAKLK